MGLPGRPGCGRKIEWHQTESGKWIPMERLPTYCEPEGEDTVKPTGKKALISHFLTCPNASEFSGGRHR